jgi:PilZ domain
MQDRRTARRYGMNLPVKLDGREVVPAPDPGGQTRDISTNGLYFIAESAPQPGTMVSLTLSLPSSLTGGEGVLVEVLARILRVEPAEARADGRVGVAAMIVQYDILRATAARPN